jgi:hypothetical protein
MNFIIKRLCPRLLASVIFLFLFICLTGCQSQKKAQPPLVETKTLAAAQEEVDDLIKLLYDPSLDNIKKAWELNYAAYFLQAQQSKSPQAQQFAKYAFDVANTTLKLSNDIPKDRSKPFKRWALILEVRTAIYDAIKAIAVLDASTENCLKNTEEEIKKIKGGCGSGTCPTLYANEVKDENERIKMFVACAKTAFNRLQDYTGQASQIAQKGCEIAKEAEENFEQKTGYDEAKMPVEGGDLIESYLQAIGMFTIALKEVYRLHPVLKSGQEVEK